MADIKELTVGGTTYKIKDEVCRTNILYTLGKVGKNLWDFANAAVSGGGGADRVTYTKSDNSIAITAVNSWAFVAFAVQLKAGTYCFQGLVSSITGSDSKVVTIRINGYDGTVIKRIEITANGVINGDFVVDTDRTITVSFYASEGTFTNSSYTISNLMIIPKEVYDAVGGDYQPYGAPNPTLTPALIECVDKGAKNKFNPEKATPDGLVTDGNGYAFKSVYSDTRTIIKFVLLGYNNDTLVRVLYDTDITSTGLFSCTFVKGSDFNFLRFGHSGTVYDIKVIVDVSNLVDGETYVLSFDVTATNPSVLIAWNSTMICTKPKWDVSHNFGPHTLPNYDLTVREAEDRAALAEQVDEGAKNILDEWNEILKNLSTSGNSVTVHGITYTNTNGTITMSGTADNPSDNAATLFLLVDTMKLSNGSYVISWRSKSISNVQTNIKYLNMVETIQSTDSVIELPSNRTDSASMWISIPNGTTVSGSIDIMICTLADWKISQNYAPFALPNTDLTRMVNDLQKKAVKVYTYHVNPNESDPEDAVTYLDDATGLTPAKMGASSFSYGSWANAWFLPKPCMLKSDGTVAYYLNPNDYSKKTDGTASDIADANFDGNVMLEFPKIWVKRVAGSASGERTVSIAPVNVDGTYKCWSNINAEDKEVDHFYLPAYNGTIHSSKMRSLSGVTLDTTYAPNYTRAQEVTAAIANNPSGKNMWYTETWADMCLVYDLLYLMGKSLDVQRTFGQGLSSGAETAMRAYVTGTHNAKGLFYGDISGTSTAVKVLGMENLWGCRWHAVAGLINDNGTLKVKMTYGVADGSSAIGYNPTGAGYLNYGSTYGTDGFVKKMQADNTMGYKIIETAGTDATYYCDYYFVNNSQSNYALLGGRSGHGADCGFCVNLHSGAAGADWFVGGSLSCRP